MVHYRRVTLANMSLTHRGNRNIVPPLRVSDWLSFHFRFKYDAVICCLKCHCVKFGLIQIKSTTIARKPNVGILEIYKIKVRKRNSY